MSTKKQIIIAIQVLISFVLFIASIFVFFTEQNILLSSQLLFTSFIFGISSFIIFIKQYEVIISANRIKIFWVIGWVFSLLGIISNVGIWSFGIIILILAIVMSYNIKEDS